MSNYIGVRCPVCNKKFVESDDIVVCPVCGAPHHRECYREQGECAFVSEHIDGKVWSDPAVHEQPHAGEPIEEGAEDTTQTKACPNCHSPNPSDSIFCQVCGSPLAGHKKWNGQERPFDYPDDDPESDGFTMAYGGLPPDEEIDGESVKDIAQYVGKSSSYYLPRFHIINLQNRVFLPNLSAFVFGSLFYFYRKMYLVGSILLALYIIGRIPSYMYAWELLPQLLYENGLGPAATVNQAMADHLFRLGNITRTINFTVTLILSFSANRSYMNQSIAAVNGIRTRQPSLLHDSYYKALENAGGTNKAAVIAVIASVLTAAFIVSMIMVYVQMSSY